MCSRRSTKKFAKHCHWSLNVRNVMSLRRYPFDGFFTPYKNSCGQGKYHIYRLWHLYCAHVSIPSCWLAAYAPDLIRLNTRTQSITEGSLVYEYRIWSVWATNNGLHIPHWSSRIKNVGTDANPAAGGGQDIHQRLQFLVLLVSMWKLIFLLCMSTAISRRNSRHLSDVARKTRWCYVPL